MGEPHIPLVAPHTPHACHSHLDSKPAQTTPEILARKNVARARVAVEKCQLTRGVNLSENTKAAASAEQKMQFPFA